MYVIIYTHVYVTMENKGSVWLVHLEKVIETYLIKNKKKL
jgi:hypothetical protein